MKIHITKIEQPDGFFDDSNSGWENTEAHTFQEAIKDLDSKTIQEIKEAQKESEWIAKQNGADEYELEGLRREIRACDNILKERSKFSIVVDKASTDKYDCRVVDLYIDVLEKAGFSICEHEDGSLHPVIADEEKIQHTLNLVFYWGQNDHQSKPVPSVSVGDVIHLQGRYFRVACVGFEELTPDLLYKYKELDSRDRAFLDNWKKLIK